MHSLLGLYCTKNHKWVLSDIAFVSRRIGFIILLFYLFLFFLQGSSVLALIFMYFNY